jgi:ATP-dependent Clp protease adaptor protein ClpS
MGTDKPDSREVILSEIEEKLTEPPMYNVLIHNDDFTTKEFVVGILMSVFNKSLEEATQIMWAAHRNGTGICGVYPYELAETKVNQASSLARENEFPLRVTMEEE